MVVSPRNGGALWREAGGAATGPPRLRPVRFRRRTPAGRPLHAGTAVSAIWTASLPDRPSATSCNTQECPHRLLHPADASDIVRSIGKHPFHASISALQAMMTGAKIRPGTHVLALCLVLLLGLVFSLSSRLYPADMPVWAPWEFSWIEYLGAALALFWYGSGIALMKSDSRPELWRQAFFGLGVVLMYAVTQTQFTYLAVHSFTVTQVQQFVLHDLGPFLVALAWPRDALKEGMPAPLLRLLRAPPVLTLFRIIQQPVVATLLFILLLVGQVLPVIMFRLMLDGRLFDTMNILMAADGVLFWCLVLDPRPRPAASISFFTRMVLIFVVMLPVMPVGGFIAFTSHSYYDFYDLCGRLGPWINPMSDQRAGGLILWIPGGLMTAIAVLLPLNAMRMTEERKERVTGKAFVRIGGRQIDPSSWTGR